MFLLTKWKKGEFIIMMYLEDMDEIPLDELENYLGLNLLKRNRKKRQKNYEIESEEEKLE